MKITKQYLKGLIKEALQQEMGVPLQKASGYDRGGGADGYEDVDSDKWSKGLGRDVVGRIGSRLSGYAKNKDSDGLLKSLKGSISREVSGTAAGKGTSMVHGDYAVANLNVEAFVEGLIEGSMQMARGRGEPGAASLLKVLQTNKDKLVSILEKEKSKTLALYPDAGKNPGKLTKTRRNFDDRGMGDSYGYETTGSERELDETDWKVGKHDPRQVANDDATGNIKNYELFGLAKVNAMTPGSPKYKDFEVMEVFESFEEAKAACDNESEGWYRGSFSRKTTGSYEDTMVVVVGLQQGRNPNKHDIVYRGNSSHKMKF